MKLRILWIFVIWLPVVPHLKFPFFLFLILLYPSVHLRNFIFGALNLIPDLIHVTYVLCCHGLPHLYH